MKAQSSTPAAHRQIGTTILATSLLVGGLTISTSVNRDMSPILVLAAKPKVSAAGLDGEATTFFQKSAQMTSQSQCSSMPISNLGKTLISHYYCPPNYMASLTGDLKVTRDFTIPSSLRHRVEFWRTIYSTWSINDYVLHTAEYPDVILEIGTSPKGAALIASGREDDQVKKTMKRRVEQYRTIFMALHRQKNSLNPANLTPVMRRIVMAMSHINEPNKYLKAAEGLRFQRGQKEFIEKGIEMSSPYLASLEQVFEDSGVPRDLAKLAFVESSFNTKALSKVGASGVYQLMPSTARQYMQVDGMIDDRKDPIKSGYAAAQVLKSNYRILGTWPLAITSYNHGPYGIRRAVRAAGSNDLNYLIQNYDGKMFGFASKNFYTEFLAILVTLNDRSRVFPNAKILPAMAFKAVRLERRTPIKTIIRNHKVTQVEFLKYNPGITLQAVSNNISLKRGHMVILPDTTNSKLAESN